MYVGNGMGLLDGSFDLRSQVEVGFSHGRYG